LFNDKGFFSLIYIMTIGAGTIIARNVPTPYIYTIKIGNSRCLG